MMQWLLGLLLLGTAIKDIVCPPVQPEIKPVEGDSPDDDPVCKIDLIF